MARQDCGAEPTRHFRTALQRIFQQGVLISLLLVMSVASHAEAKTGLLKLSWTNDSTDESGFTIERKTGTAGTFVEIARLNPGVTSFYIDLDLPSGGNHCYRVRAFNAAGYSSYSNEACATPNDSAEITTPMPGSTLTAATVTFTWSAGIGVSEYWLEVGVGGDIYSASQGMDLSRVVGRLPTAGRPVYVRLWSLIQGTWLFNDYTYNVTKAEMTSPTPGSTLTASTVTFTWSAGGAVSEYWLKVWLGGRNSAPQEMDLSRIYSASQGINLSSVISGLPTDGRPVSVQLSSLIDGIWLSNDYAYTMTEAAVTTPASGSIVSNGTLQVDSRIHHVPVLPRPALGVPIVDPVFGTTITRVSDPSMLADDPTSPAQGLVVADNRHPGLNADGTKALLQVVGGADRGDFYLIDVAAAQKLAKIASSGDPEFSWHPKDPNQALFRYGNEIRVLHADTLQIETLMTLPQYDHVTTKREGRPSDDWRYYGFLGYRLNSSGACCDWSSADMAVVDLVSKQAVSTLTAEPIPNWVGMSPTGGFVVAMFPDGQGTRLYLRDGLAYVRSLFADSAHSDFAIDENGDELLVYDAVTSEQVADFGGKRTIASVRLKDGQKIALLPIDSSLTSQISGIASRQHPGWVLVSASMTPTDPQVPFAREVFWLKTDGSGAVKRIAHHHSDVADRITSSGLEKDYLAEPHATSSWDGNTVVFTSVWGDSFARYDVYTVSGVWWP